MRFAERKIFFAPLAAMASQELIVERNPLRLLAVQGGGEESEWLLLSLDLLLQHAADGNDR